MRNITTMFLVPLLISSIACQRQASSNPEVVLQNQPLQLAAGEEKTWNFTLQSIPDGQVPTLEFNARMESNSQAGSMYFMDITVNGKTVTAADSRNRVHLLNKPLKAIPSYGALKGWYAEGAGWRVAYSPDFNSQHLQYGPETYHFVIDISEWAVPGQNKLTIRRKPVLNANPLIIRDLKLGFAPNFRPATANQELTGTPRASLASNGSVLIQYANATVNIESHFSKPGGGWYILGSRLGNGEMKPTLWFSSGDNQSIVFSAQDYRDSRNIESANGHILVHDRIENLSGRDLGMMVRHESTLPVFPDQVYLAGNDDPSDETAAAPWNPTVFVPCGGNSLGLVAESDALRAQGIEYYETKQHRMGLRTERLAIPAGGAIDLKWSIYCLPTHDYFDFVNRVRADWGVHLRLDGPYWWGFWPETVTNMTDRELTEWLKNRKIFAAVSGGGWIDNLQKETPPTIGHGVGVMSAHFLGYRERLYEAIRKLHLADPKIKVLVYNHMFFNNPEENPARFEDSWITTSNGQRYSHKVVTGDTTHGIYPTLTNTFGRAFESALDQQRQELGLDGFYLDETDFPEGLTDPVTYNNWDGCSAILDPNTHEIQQKIGYVFLLSQAYQHHLIDKFRNEGLVFLGNGQPCTLSFNQDSWPRFTEMQDFIVRASEAHLYSPLAYGPGNPDVKTIRNRLDRGVIFCCTSPHDRLFLTAHFFPITPLSLHRGWVQGEERVITDKSGKYGWANIDFNYRLWCYNSDGTLTAGAPITGNASGEVDIQVPPNGFAVLERE